MSDSNSTPAARPVIVCTEHRGVFFGNGYGDGYGYGREGV